MENADVAMPILSTHEIAKGNRSLEYFERDGKIHHLDSGEITKFVEGGGVYFMRIWVPKRLTKPQSKSLCVPDGSVGFARPGA